MIEGKTIGIVIPAYNEERLIGRVFDTMPDFVDRMFAVNDCSRDRTGEIIDAYAKKDPRIVPIHHDVNMGLGQSVIDGYLKARDYGVDVAAVMDGDAQMSPDDLVRIVGPVVSGDADYVKGNRLLHEDVFERMPRYRFLGNSVLTLLTKFATGYWHIIDPQCAYAAISKRVLARIPIEQMTKGYGYNADILNMLNLRNYRICDVGVEPIYGDAQSNIKLRSYVPRVSWLLLRLFMKRLFRKYLVREFHPLIFFYLFSFFNGMIVALPMMIRFIYFFATTGEVPPTTLLLLMFSVSFAFFSLFFAMWLDMEDNRKLIAVSTRHDADE